MHIAHISSEMAPFIKVGGLGDVLSGLCRQQAQQGHRVTVILPKYDLISDTCHARARLMKDFIFCRAGQEDYHCRIWKTIWNDVQVLCIENRHSAKFFERRTVYGCTDDVRRFTSFCSTIVQLFRQWGTAPDLFHLHDWHTAPFALLRGTLAPTPAAKTPCILTVHNFEHQGHLDVNTLSHFNIPKAQIPENAREGSGINLLKAAIPHTNYLTTVSPNYCSEVQTPLGGRGLQKLLLDRARNGLFEGILNGIDTSYWTPTGNAYLPLAFEESSLSFSHANHSECVQKRELKQRLIRRLNLTDTAGPWVICISRLVPQKGLDLIEYALEKTYAIGGTFILLGSSPIPAVKHRFEQLRARHQRAGRACIIPDYEESLAHWLFAAGDLLIVPSIFEPCGLTQMIGMRFGTIPLVRQTGGLVDTVFDFETSDKPPLERNGFCFGLPTTQELDAALTRAFTAWKHHPARWQMWMRQVMKLDFSWKRPAQRYEQIYRRVRGTQVNSKNRVETTSTSRRTTPLIAATS